MPDNFADNIQINDKASFLSRNEQIALIIRVSQETSDAQSSKKQAAPGVDVTQITDNEFANTGKQILCRLDINHKGAVTRKQLAQALEDPSYKGPEAQALAAMYKRFDALHNLSEHKRRQDNECLTVGDLDKYSKMAKQLYQRYQDAYELKKRAHTRLDSFDRNKNGRLTRGEIEKALQDSHTSDDDREMLSRLDKRYHEMGHIWEPGVKLSSFDNYYANIEQDTKEAKLVLLVRTTCINVHEGQKPDFSLPLYSADGCQTGYPRSVFSIYSVANLSQIHRASVGTRYGGSTKYTCSFCSWRL